MKELREEIERLKVALAKGGVGDPESMKKLQVTIEEMEYAKKQTWVSNIRLYALYNRTNFYRTYFLHIHIYKKEGM